MKQNGVYESSAIFFFRLFVHKISNSRAH